MSVCGRVLASRLLVARGSITKNQVGSARRRLAWRAGSRSGSVCPSGIYLPNGTLLSETIPSGSRAGTYYYLSDGAGPVAALVDSNGVVQDSYSYDPLGTVTASAPVPNPFTFEGMTFDSSTGFYYTGSGYYDPATGQSFGCQDQGWVDPGEDNCGEDESQANYCSNATAHGYSDRSQCGSGSGLSDFLAQSAKCDVTPRLGVRGKTLRVTATIACSQLAKVTAWLMVWFSPTIDTPCGFREPGPFSACARFWAMHRVRASRSSCEVPGYIIQIH